MSLEPLEEPIPLKPNTLAGPGEAYWTCPVHGPTNHVVGPPGAETTVICCTCHPWWVRRWQAEH